METISASLYPTTPRTETSHIRSSRYSNPRPMQQPDAVASQESPVSAGSSLRPRLETDSSNISQKTNSTDLTSPTSSAPEPVYAKPQVTRLKTPEGLVAGGEAITSPMSVASPAFSVNGTKRTASGHVKNLPSLSGTPAMSTAGFAGSRPRGDSTSSTSSRAGELAANLKTRLGYAMAKVQNGWEHRNISEVEQLAAHKAHAHRRSMSHLDYSRRPQSAGLSNGAVGLSLYEDQAYGQSAFVESEAYHPSKRRSGTFDTFIQTSSQPVQGSAPYLQPAADIRPLTDYHTNGQHYSLSQPQPTKSTAMSPPRTPLNGSRATRPPTIRTETQTAEAERDALQALFQLGSPHASQMSNSNGNGYPYLARGYQHSQASSSQASPLRSEFGPTAMTTPRRVTFARSESDSSAMSSSNAGEDRGLARRESDVSSGAA